MTGQIDSTEFKIEIEDSLINVTTKTKFINIKYCIKDLIPENKIENIRYCHKLIYPSCIDDVNTGLFYSLYTQNECYELSPIESQIESEVRYNYLTNEIVSRVDPVIRKEYELEMEVINIHVDSVISLECFIYLPALLQIGNYELEIKYYNGQNSIWDNSVFSGNLVSNKVKLNCTNGRKEK